MIPILLRNSERLPKGQLLSRRQVTTQSANWHWLILTHSILCIRVWQFRRESTLTSTWNALPRTAMAFVKFSNTLPERLWWSARARRRRDVICCKRNHATNLGFLLNYSISAKDLICSFAHIMSSNTWFYLSWVFLYRTSMLIWIIVTANFNKKIVNCASLASFALVVVVVVVYLVTWWLPDKVTVARL